MPLNPFGTYEYTNFGLTAAAEGVAAAAGLDWATLSEQAIYRPLGMDRTLYEPDYADSRLAKGYTTFALSPPEAVAPEGRGWK